MTATVQDFLSAFDRLSADEQREVLSELLRRTRDMEWPSLDDAAINQIAAESFREYDAREAADGEG